MTGRTIAALLLSLALGTSQACAAPTAAHAPRAHHARARHPAPPAPAAAARLMAFRGVWQFDGTVTMGANKPRKVRWRLGCKIAAGGWALACDDTIHLPKSPVLHETDLFAYDAAAGVVRFYLADNRGAVRELEGKWIDDHTINYHYEGSENGKPIVEDAKMVLRDPATFDIDDTMSVGGKSMIAFRGTFHLQPKHTRPRHGANAPAAAKGTATDTAPAQ